jgi:alanine racemase
MKRPTQVHIDLDAITHNYQLLKQIAAPARVCAVVKADAYGHGMVDVSRALQSVGADYFAVAIIEEGIELRNAGITAPILVMGGSVSDQLPLYIEYDLSVTVPSIDVLESVSRIATAMQKPARIHIKIDTGMGRLGIHWERADSLFHEVLKHLDHLVIEGIYSHFSDANDSDWTQLQYQRFTQVLSVARGLGLDPAIAHVSKSTSALLYPDMHMDMIRPGLMLYGIYDEPQLAELGHVFKPAMTWKTHVVYFKVVKRGEYVGYGRTWTPTAEFERVVTLPVGYADGYPRRAGNNGFVLIRGKRYPIVGRVCMDQMMVSLGQDGEAYPGDEVVLLGTQDCETITAEEIAGWVDTTPHEIPTVVSKRVPRIY